MTHPIRYTTAWALHEERSATDLEIVSGGVSRTFVRAPGFDSPTEVFHWLFERGCELSRCWVHVGPDRQWRGSGEVT